MTWPQAPIGWSAERQGVRRGGLRELYHFSPGTVVTAQAKRLGLQRSGGKNVMTFVYYPVRR